MAVHNTVHSMHLPTLAENSLSRWPAEALYYSTSPNVSAYPPSTPGASSNPAFMTPGTQETGVSPMRFCVQAKDRFVVRIVKVTEKSVYLSTGQSPAALPPPPTPLNPRSLRTSLMDPDEMRFYQNKLLQPATGGTCVYVGFQAQLPALRTEFVTRSTSADEVNSLPMIVHRRRNVGKGIRLCFSCPLRGNGLKIEDFYSGTISQRLNVWEKSSGRPGLLKEILQALNYAVNLLLTQIKLDGFLTVHPESDYIYFPYFPDGMLRHLQQASRTPSCSSDPAAPGSPNRGPLLISPPQRGGPSPIVSPCNDNPQISVQVQQRRHNPLLSPAMSSSRPASAYGIMFGSAGVVARSQSLLQPTPLQGGNSPGIQTPEYITFVSNQTDNSHVSSTAPQNVFFPNDHPETLPGLNVDARYHNSVATGTSLFQQQSAHISPVASICYLTNATSHLHLSPQSINLPTTTTTTTSSLLPPAPPHQMTGAVNSIATQTSSASQKPAAYEDETLNRLINEVTTRLRNSPQLPLVVMPSIVPGCAPLVFQPPSPEVVFVGLPATMNQGDVVERPRLVISPAETSAFVVSSRRSADLSPRFTVAAPQPGCMLGVSADGEIFQYKPISTEPK